jgi:hypothetical protein
MKTSLAVIFLLLSAFTCECEEDAIVSNRCTLEPDPGPCYAYMPRYYFDKTERRCKEFIWAGCEGVVPFQTMEECKACQSGEE